MTSKLLLARALGVVFYATLDAQGGDAAPFDLAPSDTPWSLKSIIRGFPPQSVHSTSFQQNSTLMSKI